MHVVAVKTCEQSFINGTEMSITIQLYHAMQARNQMTYLVTAFCAHCNIICLAPARLNLSMGLDFFAAGPPSLPAKLLLLLVGVDADCCFKVFVNSSICGIEDTIYIT